MIDKSKVRFQIAAEVAVHGINSATSGPWLLYRGALMSVVVQLWNRSAVSRVVGASVALLVRHTVDIVLSKGIQVSYPEAGLSRTSDPPLFLSQASPISPLSTLRVRKGRQRAPTACWRQFDSGFCTGCPCTVLIRVSYPSSFFPNGKYVVGQCDVMVS